MHSIKKLFALLLVALVVLSALQVEDVSAAKSDLIFLNGRFIKKDKRGVIVLDNGRGCQAGRR